MNADRPPSSDLLHEQDRMFMAVALDRARSIPVRPWPNPPVGAVVVRDGRVAGAGAHHGPGTPHAEIMALQEAGEAARGATLYVTLEPCNHTGRTPPCAPAVADSGVRRVVVGMRDPNPHVTGGGCRHLRDCGIEVVCGVRAREALELVWPFVVTRSFARPFVELKTAQSLDGCFAPEPGPRDPLGPAYLTGVESRREVHRVRTWMDAVLVGERTAHSDRPRLDTRLAGSEADGPLARPLPGYVDSDLSLGERVGEGPFLVVAGRGAEGSARAAELRTMGAELLFVDEADGHAAPAAVIEALHRRGLHTVMIEGGPRLAAAFLAAGMVDRWRLFTAPVFLGGGVRWPRSTADGKGYSLTALERFGGDTMGVYDRLVFDDVLGQVTL
ncbi:MAG: bifunctional diaminohydroxyphosphoribosylaminopyrimidine deaminase/5-amino-6-(5-phosphoribosylamino)uracil reductase RibD [Candidatus Krumholzibacteriia bacterium]